MMRALKSFGAFWYDFVIGDDWQVAAIVAVLGPTITLLPLAAFAALAWSLHRATSGKS